MTGEVTYGDVIAREPVTRMSASARNSRRAINAERPVPDPGYEQFCKGIYGNEVIYARDAMPERSGSPGLAAARRPGDDDGAGLSARSSMATPAMESDAPSIRCP